MTTHSSQRRRGRGVRIFVSILVIGAVTAGLAYFGPGLFRSIQDGMQRMFSECTVTAEETIGLDRDQAQRAITAVALAARGLDTPDTSDLDDRVLEQLAQGPSDDAGPSLACQGEAGTDLPEQEPTDTGLTPRAEQVRESITEVFGDLPMGGFAPGGVDEGHVPDSTHYDGRAIDIFFRPVTEENRRQGWIVAQWLVAHADELHVQYVIFDDLVWSARSARGQWADYDAPDPANEILRHLDHVHVDVLGGEPVSDGPQT